MLLLLILYLISLVFLTATLMKWALDLLADISNIINRCLLLENLKINQVFKDIYNQKVLKNSRMMDHFDDLSFKGQYPCFPWGDYDILVLRELIPHTRFLIVCVSSCPLWIIKAVTSCIIPPSFTTICWCIYGLSEVKANKQTNKQKYILLNF